MIDITRAIQYLEETQGLVLPYELLPYSTYEGGINTMFNEELWALYDWLYPPEGIDRLAEEDASAKPSWVKITNALALVQHRDRSEHLILQANDESTRRIALAYHPLAGRDRNKEWQVRLSEIDLATKDAERVRLIAVCHAIEARINAATTTAQLDAIDITSDSVWSADDD